MLCHNDIWFTSVYDSKNVLWLKKSSLDTSPPPVLVFVHGDHDVYRRRSIR